MIKTFFALAAVLCLFSSCATLSRKDYDLTVTSDAQGARARIKDEEKTLPATFTVRHSRDTLAVTLITDSLQKQYTVAPRLRPMAYAGNAVWMIWYPLAYYIDKKSDKGYYYGKHLYLDADSTQAIRKSAFTVPVKAYNDTYKGRFNLSFSVPYLNNYYLHPKMSPAIKSTGFWGFSAGFEYFYKDNRFIKLSGLAAMDSFLPVLAAVDSDGEREGIYTLCASLTDNVVLNRFTLGYGLAYAKNKWFYDNDGTDPDAPLRPGIYERKERATLSFGLQFNGYYRVVKSFYAGIIYNPYLYDIAPNGQFNYQHTLSLDFMWKLDLPSRHK